MSLEEEKEKARFIHKLEIKKMVIDKLILGIVLSFLGFLLNMYVERFRENSVRQQFFLEQKMQEISNIRDAYGAMFHGYDDFTVSNGALSDINSVPMGLKLDTLIGKFHDAVDKNSVLMSPEFIHRLDVQSWLYACLKHTPASFAIMFREFFMDQYYHFPASVQKELGMPEKDTAQVFVIQTMSHEEAEKIGAPGYLINNFRQWEEYRKTHNTVKN